MRGADGGRAAHPLAQQEPSRLRRPAKVSQTCRNKNVTQAVTAKKTRRC